MANPNGGPRKRQRYTEAQVAEAIIAAEGLQTHAARSLGCTPRTIRHYLKRYPRLQQLLNDEREKFVDLAETNLRKNVRAGDTGSILFTLKCLGKERGYIEKSDLNVTGNIKAEIVLPENFPGADESAA